MIQILNLNDKGDVRYECPPMFEVRVNVANFSKQSMCTDYITTVAEAKKLINSLQRVVDGYQKAVDTYKEKLKQVKKDERETV